MSKQERPRVAGLPPGEVERPSGKGFAGAAGAVLVAGTVALLITSTGGGGGSGHNSAPSRTTGVERSRPMSPATTKAIGELGCSSTNSDSNFQNITPSEAQRLLSAGSLPKFQQLWKTESGQQAPCSGGVGNIVYSLDPHGDSADLAEALVNAIDEYYGETPMVEDFGTSTTIGRDNISVDLKGY